jgi:hypothetical protein
MAMVKRVGGALLALVFLTQAQSKSLIRLLGIPAVALACWLLLVFFLHGLS